MGYRLVQAVFVVTLGRLGDMYGRVQDLQRGLRRLHRRVGPAVDRPLLGDHCGHVADRLALRPGHRRLHADGELGRHPHRRFSRESTWLRARHQPGGRPVRAVHRPGRGWAAGDVGLARRLLGQRARRHLRHALGLRRLREIGTQVGGPHRLVGQRHLRRGPRLDPHRGHDRDPAVPRPGHGLDEPRGAGAALRRAGLARSPSSLIETKVVDPLFRSASSASGPLRPATWPASPPAWVRAGCSSCSSSGCRASGCRCTATATARPRCGPASSCCRSRRASSLSGPLSRPPVRSLRRPGFRHDRHGRLRPQLHRAHRSCP